MLTLNLNLNSNSNTLLRKRFPKALILTLTLSLLSGCGSAPLSFIETTPRMHLTSSHLYPIHIQSVDGSIQFERSIQLTAGPHELVIYALGGKGARSEYEKKVTLTIAACTRYYFLAERETPMSRDWKLIEESRETVAGCDPETELKKSELSSRSKS
jgi:hypothetical protein